MRAIDALRRLAAVVAMLVTAAAQPAFAAACNLPTTYGIHGAGGTSLSNLKINAIDLSASGCTAGSPGTCNSVAPNGAYTQATMTLPPLESFQASSVSTTTNGLATVPAGDYGTLNVGVATFTGGTYRITTANVSGSLTMAAGTYYIDRFDFGSGKVNINVTSGPVVLHIGSYMGSTGDSHKISDKGAAADLQIVLHSGAAFSIGSSTVMAALVYSPHANSSFNAGTNLDMTGAIITKGTVTAGNTFKLAYGATEQAALANLQTCNSGPANFLVERFGGGAIGTQTAGVPFAIRITARDASNATLTSFTGTVVISSTGMLSQGSGVTAAFVNGVLASHTVAISNTGTFTITATQSGGSATGTGNAFQVIAPSRFNAFDTSTAAGAITGTIRTKIAASAFSLALVAINAAGTAVETSFTGTVVVDLLDASDNSGALNGTTNCRATWTVLQTLSPNPTFSSSDAGRINVSFTEAGARRDVRVRVSWTPPAGGSAVVGCSTDNFAVRPDRFVSLQATDNDDRTTGTARTLNNTLAAAGVVHRAGRAFTVLAQAVSATGAATAGYSAASGVPTLTVASCVQPAGCAAGAISSTLSAAGGVVTGTAIYNEAGVITVNLQDTGFAAVDAADSTLAERTISTTAAVTVGRFVPDAYQLSVSTAPQFAAPLCAAGPSRQGFNFVGQPFAFGTAPVVLAAPLNASGAALANARPRYLAANVSNSVSAAGAPVALAGTTGVSNIAHAATSLISFDAGSFAFSRGAAPVASFTPTLTMTVNLADTTENGVTGNSTINATSALTITPIDFAAAAGTFHYGRAQLRPTYGDIRRELYAPLEVQRFNGLGWIALPEMAACLVAPATTFAYSNATGLLNGGGGATNCASRVASAVTTSSGRAAIRLDKPGGVTTADASAMTMTLNLLSFAAGTSCSGATPTAATTVNAPWLANPDGTNPSARLTWGRLRGELLGLRERFD